MGVKDFSHYFSSLSPLIRSAAFRSPAPFTGSLTYYTPLAPMCGAVVIYEYVFIAIAVVTGGTHLKIDK